MANTARRIEILAGAREFHLGKQVINLVAGDQYLSNGLRDGGRPENENRDSHDSRLK
jgi:hypothetical protein